MEELIEIIREVFLIEDVRRTRRGMFFVGRFVSNPDFSIKYIKERFKEMGYLPTFSRDGEQIEIGIIPYVKEEKINFKVPIILFLLTIVTTLFAGALQQGANPLKNPLELVQGVPFSFTLMAILLSHEMGHFLTSRHFNVQSTPPYFLPVPHPLIGTFGAFIKMKSPVPHKRALLLIGGMGPLVGFLVAIPLTIIGLKYSTMVPVEEIKGGLFLGGSLFFSFLSSLFAPTVSKGQELLIHPMAFAGWLGMWVTALNLIPLSQLDGGHIVYALFGKSARHIAMVVIPLMLLLGFLWAGWFLWAIFPLFLGIEHPPPLNALNPLTKREKIFGFLMLSIFIITFIPVPFSVG